MGIIVLHDRVYGRREITSATASTTATAATSSPSVPVTQPLPTSVKALAGFIVVLGLVVLGIVAWKIGKWRRSKIRAASQLYGNIKPKTTTVAHVDLALAPKIVEKQEAVCEPYKWQPIARPEPARAKVKVVRKDTNRFLNLIFHPKLAVSSGDSSPPPAYSPPAPSPPIITIDAPRNSAASIPRLDLQILSTDPHPSTPIPSPVRTKSIGPDTPLYKSLTSASKLGVPEGQAALSRLLPRLMVVTSTFVPSLADELAVKVGEPLLMLEEYEDQWCLAQRVGKGDVQRGVVPRFCLQDFPEKGQIIRAKVANPEDAH